MRRMGEKAMTSLCRMCAYEQADCKGNKDLEKIHCPYYKKPTVFNAKEAAERIAELEAEVERLRTEPKWIPCSEKKKG